jgi:hypothetical protein
MHSDRQYFNPVEWLERFWGINAPHITFDPVVKPQYRIIRSSTSDGTLIFTLQMLASAFDPLVAQDSFYKPNPPTEDVKEIQYVLGWARHATIYGSVWLPCSKTHKYPGQHERITIPVRCSYVY